MPTPTLPIEKSEFGRLGVGKKPLGFLPTPTLPIKKREFGRLGSLGRVGVGKKPEPLIQANLKKLEFIWDLVNISKTFSSNTFAYLFAVTSFPITNTC